MMQYLEQNEATYPAATSKANNYSNKIEPIQNEYFDTEKIDGTLVQIVVWSQKTS